jgi:hypothetical protein
MTAGCASRWGPREACYELRVCVCASSAAYGRFALLPMCDKLWVNPYQGKQLSTDNIIYHWRMWSATWSNYSCLLWKLSIIKKHMCLHSLCNQTLCFYWFSDFHTWISWSASPRVDKSCFKQLRGGYEGIYGRGNSQYSFSEGATNFLWLLTY